jgi:hypothetical protein
MAKQNEALLSKEDRKQTIIDALSKLLIPILLFGLGVCFNISTNNNQEKQRAQERFSDSLRQLYIRVHDDELRRTDRVEAYIKHLSSNSPRERDLAMRVIRSYEFKDVFDVPLIELVAQSASEGSTAERIRAIEVLGRGAQSSDTSVRIAALAGIRNTPKIPIKADDSKREKKTAALINQNLDSARNSLNPWLHEVSFKVEVCGKDITNSCLISYSSYVGYSEGMRMVRQGRINTGHYQLPPGIYMFVVVNALTGERWGPIERVVGDHDPTLITLQSCP